MTHLTSPSCTPKDGKGPNVALDALRLGGPSTAADPPRLYADDQAAEVGRLIGLGATRVVWENQPPGEDYVILADPEGNRFCVIDKAG